VIPVLETRRLKLRGWREGDVGPLHGFANDADSNAVYGEGATRYETWQWMAMLIGHFSLRGFGLWALEEKASAELVGFGGLWFPEGWDDVEVGYGIVPGHRGKGFAPEAARCARDHGFRELGLRRLVSYIQPANRNSIRVAEKLGAIPDGTFTMKDKPHTVYVHTNTDQKE
jgi:RimJ/RimL family protein N-acetyltransferase